MKFNSVKDKSFKKFLSFLTVNSITKDMSYLISYLDIKLYFDNLLVGRSQFGNWSLELYIFNYLVKLDANCIFGYSNLIVIKAKQLF